MITFSALVLGGLAVFIMYTAIKSTQRPSRDAQGKMCGLMIVIGAVGLLLIYGTHDKVDFGIFRQDQADLNDMVRVGGTGDSKVTGGTGDSKVTDLTPSKTYGVVFDAGSTGSRIHVFVIVGGYAGKPYAMEDELFIEVKPGLSAYKDDPKKGAESLRSMLDKAKEYVPKEMWSKTPISLKATAGLRLLPPEKSKAILDEVEAIIRTYPFLATGKFVDIMDGTDEGVFSWFTVNFLKGTTSNLKNSVAVMDLGGGSTQITFVPTKAETESSSPKDYFTTINLTGEQMKLYTHSYLGLGLMSGRLQTLGGKEGSANPATLSSPCFPADFTTFFVHGSVNYTIRGINDQAGRTKACYTHAKAVVDSYKVHKPLEVSSTHFVLISYYFDRATDAGIMPKGEGSELKVEDFISAASMICENFKQEAPFLCLDLSYIHALLQDGFGFLPATKVTVLKRISGREISWGLGAMFKMLNNNSQAAPAAR